MNTAVDHLLPLVETEEGVSLWPAFATRTLANTIEALVAAGDLERAQPIVDRLEEHASDLECRPPRPRQGAAAAWYWPRKAMMDAARPRSRPHLKRTRVFASRPSSPAPTRLRA